MTTFQPSKYQAAIFDAVRNGNYNIVVRALAGSGKTTVLVEIAKILQAMGVKNALFLAYNTHIAKELKNRLAGTPVTASTVHSLGNSILIAALEKRPRVNDQKYRKLAEEYVRECNIHPDHQKMTANALEKLLSKTRLTMSDPKDLDRLGELSHQFEIIPFDDDKADKINREIMFTGVSPLLERGQMLAKQTGEINFDDMLCLPLELNLDPPHRYPWVLADEVQDFNIAQRKMALKMLAPDGRMIAVGDPLQSLYSFLGADPQAFEELIKELHAKEMPLSICYRCPSSHLALVRNLVPEIEDRPNVSVGEVQYLPVDMPNGTSSHVLALAQKGDIVLCRKNAETVVYCFAFIVGQVSATIKGRDIGRTVIQALDAVQKFAGNRFRLFDLPKHIIEWREKQAKAAGDNEEKLQKIEDRADTLQACIEGFAGQYDTLEILKNKIEGLFQGGDGEKEAVNPNLVNIMTIHKAKGLEGKRIFLHGYNDLPLQRKNMTPVAVQQENNVLYVAMTRAKESLFLVGSPKKGWKSTPSPTQSSPVESVVEAGITLPTDTIEGLAKNPIPPPDAPKPDTAPAQPPLPLPPATPPTPPPTEPLLLGMTPTHRENYWRRRALTAENKVGHYEWLIYRHLRIVQNGGHLFLRVEGDLEMALKQIEVFTGKPIIRTEVKEVSA